MADLYVAFDIGGTNNRVALVSDQFKVIDYLKEKSDKSTPDAIFKQSKKLFQDILEKNKVAKKDVLAVGLSLAGSIDKTGRVYGSRNLKLKAGSNPAAQFKKILKLPTYALNDMKAAALGELNYGLGMRYSNFICITVSTGIGSAIVIDGKVYFGANGFSGSVGHMIINLPQDFESLGSGTGLENSFRKLAGKSLNAHDIQELAEAGDPKAKKVFDDSAIALGYGFSNIIRILDPEVIIAHGSHILLGWNLLLPRMRKIINKNTRSRVRIIKTKLGSGAAFLGAAHFAKGKGKI